MTVASSLSPQNPQRKVESSQFTVPAKMSAAANPNSQISSNGFPQVSPYELSREERIKENLQRMQKLGIMDLTHKLNSLIPSKRRCRNSSSSPCSSPLPPSGPARRSSRLQNTAPVSYSEVVPEEKSRGVRLLRLEEGSRPEVYTKEHEKLLGNTERSWTLFVDGYGTDGNRIYDPIKGKTCHQCRQKTLGYRTQCCKCNLVQGQFCGDCLYMRYGEHVLEALENPDWICPACRGICNCSLCRNAKGWTPTGTLYKKITKLGFKSVAHYLIQTKQANTENENNADDKEPVSAKRSLSFPVKEALDEETGGSHSDKENETHRELNPVPVYETPVEKSNPEIEIKEKECEGIEVEANGISELDVEEKSSNKFKGELKKESHQQEPNSDEIASNISSESHSKRKKKSFVADTSADSIGRRLRQRRIEAKVENLPTLDIVLFETESQKEKELAQDVNKISVATKPDSITSESHSKRKKKSFVADTSADSIGRRLRQRRNEAKAESFPTLDIVLFETAEPRKEKEVPRDVKISVATKPDCVARRLRPRN